MCLCVQSWTLWLKQDDDVPPALGERREDERLVNPAELPDQPRGDTELNSLELPDQPPRGTEQASTSLGKQPPKKRLLVTSLLPS